MSDTILTNPSDVDITLTCGEFHLTVSPLGASLRGLSRIASSGNAAPIVTEYRGAKAKMGGQGDVLIPFPGRVREGAYTFAGHAHQLPKNDKESPSAIHGFLREVVWDVASQTGHEIVFRTKLAEADYASKGYPFSLDVTLAYKVTDAGMECRFTIANVGTQTAPVAAGFHPYFTAGTDLINSTSLLLPFDSYLDMDGFMPTGQILPVQGTPLDFQQSRSIGDTRLNTCFVGPRRDDDGFVRVVLVGEGGRRVTVWLDESCDYVVLYSGDPLPESHRRRSLAVEPMTCGVDAFNHPQWGLVSLQPGQEFRGSWGVVSE
jgi:aldose 1-epimerase